LGEGSVLQTTLDFENGIRVDEIVDVEIMEKRKRDDLQHPRRIHARIDETPTPPTPSQPPVLEPIYPAALIPPVPANQPPQLPLPVHIEEVLDQEMQNAVPAPAQPPLAKFHLVSELGQTVNASHIGEAFLAS
jgi:hypothetical protein